MMPIITVEVRKKICGAMGRENAVMLKKTFYCPFAPTKDTCFIVKYPDLSYSEEIYIKEINWLVIQKYFVCYTEPEREIEDAMIQRRPIPPMKEVVDRYVAKGWEVYNQ